MLDYRGIEALHTVQELQSFEAAAKKLNITQSAISQRIKALEISYGEPVLIRTLPYRPTQLGTYLIGHFKRLCLLEESLHEQIGVTKKKTAIAIAINRDSLETWFLDCIEQTESFKHIQLEIIADDQELTLNYLKNGLVSACLSTCSKEVIGGQVTFLGHMDYWLVASPAFIKNYFPKKGRLKQNLFNAPAIKFDQKDQLHEQYLEKYFGWRGEELNFHTIPSVRGFKKYALLGYGYALIPYIDIVEEIKQKELVQLCDQIWKIPLYWHSWTLESELYKKFNANVIDFVKNNLFFG